ncbi:MAG: LysM peptidoglycan-binding domain-containing protein [Sulfurifustaceae bacterium]
MFFLRLRRFLSIAFVFLIGSGPALLSADEVQLRPDHPDRYTVVKGDTLWDIATRFLQSPWHWPRIWRINEGIRNPHLIYPGDVILLRYVNGQPELTLLRNEKLSPDEPATPNAAATARAIDTGRILDDPDRMAAASSRTKVLPQVYSEPVERAIPTITPDIIAPFLTQPLAMDEKELRRAGYVTVGLDNRIALGTHSQFYARGVRDKQAEYFQIFRPGKALRNPESGELLAYEAIYLGDAERLESGDPAKLIITAAKQEILPTDRLVAAAARAPVPYYFPHAPSKRVRGYIVGALNSVGEIGSHTVVAVSLGQREGIEEGHVLRALYKQGYHIDPVTEGSYKLPEEESALLLVFRTFEKVSYALVLNATRPLHLSDAVTTP